MLAARGIEAIDGALADLGVSSLQIDAEGRGFSFRRDEPLDMRMDRSAGATAADLVNATPEGELADIIFRFGEERHSRRIARAIVEARRRGPIATTGQLAATVRRAVPTHGWQRIDPATRTFQALRIWVNRELEGLERFLRDVVTRLRGGRARRRDQFPLSRGSHREAHVPCPGARRSHREGVDETAGRARRRRSWPETLARGAPSCAPRSA